MATQEEAILTYCMSNMVLAIHSNALYLSKPKACSCTGGHMFMARKDKIPSNNGAILNIFQIMWAVMSSAAEAELGALFINAKTTISMQQRLIEHSHPQPRTPIQTDNATAHTLLTNNISPKALKAMDMRFHWLQCRDAQGLFRYYWRPGTQNLVDYFTKHHPATHHKTIRPTILTAVNNLEYRKLFMPPLALPPEQSPICHPWPSRQKTGEFGESVGKEKEQTTKIHVTPTKTSVVIKSLVKTLFLTPKFQGMQQNTITARGA
jgi:hypothetical protein